MYASTFADRLASPRHMGSMYRQVSLETGIAGASPHRLVAMLFEGFMEALAQARGGMREGHIEVKGRAIGRAVRIVEEGLRASLDKRADGTLAQDLDDLYAYLGTRLTMANLRDDEAALDECQRLMLPLQQAWSAIAPAAQESRS